MKERKKTPAKGKNSSDDFFFLLILPKKKQTYIHISHITYIFLGNLEIQLLFFCRQQKIHPGRHGAPPATREVSPNRLSTPLVLLRPPVTRSRSSPMILALVVPSTNESFPRSGYRLPWRMIVRYPMGVFYVQVCYLYL